MFLSLKYPHMTNIPMKTLQLVSNSTDLKRYSEWIQKQSEERLSRVSRSLSKILEDEQADGSIAIYTTWSDGRGENKIFEGPRSNVELSIFSWEMTDVKSGVGLDHVREKSVQLINTIRKTSSFILDNIEFKKTKEDSLVLYNNQENLVFPTRIWDSYQLWGNPQMNNQIKELLSKEIVQNPKMTKHFHDRLRTHRSVLKDGALRIWGRQVVGRAPYIIMKCQ